jgi:hypothetical protein
MHAFWSRGQVDVECVIDGIYESVEGGGILLALSPSDFDMSSVAGVHFCVWLTAGGTSYGQFIHAFWVRRGTS